MWGRRRKLLAVAAALSAAIGCAPALAGQSVLVPNRVIYPGETVVANALKDGYTELVVASLRCDPGTHHLGHRGEIPTVAPKPPRKTRTKT